MAAEYASSDTIAFHRRRYTAEIHREFVTDLFDYVAKGHIDVNLACFIADVLGPGDWRKDAACRGEDVNLFFMTKQGSTYDEARAICETCEVRSECEEYARSAPETVGLWAGFSVNNRRRREARRTGTRPEGHKRVCIDCFCELAGWSSTIRCSQCRTEHRKGRNGTARPSGGAGQA